MKKVRAKHIRRIVPPMAKLYGMILKENFYIHASKVPENDSYILSLGYIVVSKRFLATPDGALEETRIKPTVRLPEAKRDTQ